MTQHELHDTAIITFNYTRLHYLLMNLLLVVMAVDQARLYNNRIIGAR